MTIQSQSIFRSSFRSQQIGGHSKGVTGRNQAGSLGRGLAEGGGFSTEHTQTEGTAKERERKKTKMK